MPRAKLSKYVEEDVTLLQRTVTNEVSDANPYGEQIEVFVDLQVVRANVQPLGADLRGVYQLQGSVEALRVQLPLSVVAPLDRIAYRGRQWIVIHSEIWQSYTLLHVQGVQGG